MSEPHKITCTIDVSRLHLSGCNSVQLDLFVPYDPGDAPVLWCCVPGGGMSRAYFDLDVPSQFGEFSMARAAARRGVVVMTIDPPGVGGSDAPDDGYELTPRAVAAVLDAVTIEMTARLASGSVPDVGPVSCGPTVGVGHSAGLVGQLSAGSPPIVRCAGDPGLFRHRLGAGPERHRAGHDRSTRPAAESAAGPRPTALRRSASPTPRCRSRSEALGRDHRCEPGGEGGRRAPAAGRLLGLVGLMAIVPYSMKSELDEIDVPVFAAIGEYDIAGDIGLLVGQLPACTDLTLFRLPGVGHNHNESGWRPAPLGPDVAMVRSIDKARRSRGDQ